MHFWLFSMSVVYVLTTPMPEDGGDNLTVDQVRKRAKWDNDDYVYRGLILNGSMTTKHHDTRADPNKKPKVTYWKCGKPRHLKRDCEAGNVGNKANGSGTKGLVDGSSNPLNVDSGATIHVCKDRCWFKTYESLNDGSILHMGNKSTALVHGRGCVDLRFSSGKVVSLLNVLHVPNIRKNLVSISILNNCGYKQVIESNRFVLSKHGVFIGFGYLSNHMFRLNIVSDNIGSAFMSTSKLNDSILWHGRLGHVHFKRMQDMSKDGLIPAFDMDTEKYKTCMLTKITKKPFQNIKRKTEVLELIYSDMCDLRATPSLGNKKYFVTFINDASRFCYVYLLHSNDEALDKFKVFKTEVELQQGSLIKKFKTYRGGEYMDTLYFHSAESRVLGAVVRLPNPKLKTLSEKGIKCIFVGYAEHFKAFRFYVIEPNDSVAINLIIESKDAIFDENRFSSVPRPSQRSLKDGTEGSGGSVVPKKVTEENDPKIFDEAIKSQDVAFWKEAINDEMDFIMGNNTWVLTNLPPGCKPLGCKWIFKRKLKVDGTAEKFKARLVIQGFKQKLRIDYFDTYAPMARISTIRLVIAMASIHNLIIHQMDVKTAFLNGELEEEVYMNQPLGFILPGNENKVCKLIKYLYGLKQAPKQWHQKFDEVVFSNGYLLNQADKYVYRKFDESGKGVIICLYVDDMLIFGTDQVQVDLTKKNLSSRFSMKDMREADVILVSTPMDTYEKLMPNKGQVVSQLEYSRVIGWLMYAMTCTRPDIAFAVGKLTMYTSNPGTQHWQAIQRVLKYLKNTMDYRLIYTGYPSVLEGYTDASKKQTCITGSTMEYEFVALAAAGKEAEWLKNLLLEIPLHLDVRHNMIRELIMNGVVSIEFVRSQQNLADHLMKGLARDLRTEAHVLQIIPRMCLVLADKEDEVANFSMVNFFEKVLSRSMNKEEPPMVLFIPVDGNEGTECTPKVTGHPDSDSG
ncbi:zinc finger, CCHC-type containing protein [Tanacetum coccineum]